MFKNQSTYTTNENGYEVGNNVEQFPNFVFNVNRYTSDTEEKI